ncbi:nucleoplasmin-2a isoform X1 [Hemibagrus wyckioides]|uniref:nucleoplasmin-2a isoform X1 n=1 Tax=Hemibagrus wyckioides TaxID=337641 RepID=UPI00266BA31F|nr:nucleoplasmin-2a isoform X1 [Hemibagrus wyckioides]
MTTCIAEDISITSVDLSDVTSSSSISDKVCVHWGRTWLFYFLPYFLFSNNYHQPLCIHVFVFYPGCELSSSQTTVVFEAEDDLLENQFFIKTICLSAQASDELHVVAVSDGVGESKPIPIATLRHCMPTVSFPALELMPPVTFNLCSGKGPVFISAQHITLNPTENTEEEEDGGGSFLVDDLTD